MTMVIVVDEDGAEEALASARKSSHEHPARVIGLILGSGRGKPSVNAQIGIGDGWSGEVALLRLSGEVVKHAESVVLPLLLPDSPVVVWWANDHPDDPAADPIGRLAMRRITDAAAVRTGKTKAVHRLCAAYAPGTTDLAWTRLTPWRALLAAALDQQPLKVRSATVTAERISPSADLLAAWLADRLHVKVARVTSEGPGITDVVMDTADGPIEVQRKDGRLATFRSPGQPDRPVALKRRDVPELLAEELRAARRGRRLRRDREEAGLQRDRQACPEEAGGTQEGGQEVSPEVVRHDDAGSVAADVATRLLEELARVQAEGREPQIALTGGTIADAVHREVARLSADSGVDWSRVVVWWGDERFVAADDPDRNAGQARAAFLDGVGATQAHEMPSTADAATVDEGAASYARVMREHGAGEFDVVMLGVGPDGHVASLFPGSRHWTSTTRSRSVSPTRRSRRRSGSASPSRR